MDLSDENQVKGIIIAQAGRIALLESVVGATLADDAFHGLDLKTQNKVHDGLLQDATCDLRAEVERLTGWLKRIRDFGHVEGCTTRMVPIYECCCIDDAGLLGQWEMAKAALAGLPAQAEGGV